MSKYNLSYFRRQFFGTLLGIGLGLASLVGGCNNSDNTPRPFTPLSRDASKTTVMHVIPTSQTSYDFLIEDDRGLETIVLALEMDAAGDLDFQRRENGNIRSYAGVIQETALKNPPPPPPPPLPPPPFGAVRHTQVGDLFSVLEGGKLRVYEFTDFVVDPYNPADSSLSVATFTFTDMANGQAITETADTISGGHETYTFNGSVIIPRFSHRLPPLGGADPNTIDQKDLACALTVDQNGNGTFGAGFITSQPPLGDPTYDLIQVLGEGAAGITYNLDPKRIFREHIAATGEPPYFPYHPATITDQSGNPVQDYSLQILNTVAGTTLGFVTDSSVAGTLDMLLEVNGIVVNLNPIGTDKLTIGGVEFRYRRTPYGNVEFLAEQP